jgi:transposase
MIGLPTGDRVWLAAGHADIRRGMRSLALQVQEGLRRDPHAGDLYVFRMQRIGLRLRMACSNRR